MLVVVEYKQDRNREMQMANSKEGENRQAEQSTMQQLYFTSAFISVVCSTRTHTHSVSSVMHLVLNLSLFETILYDQQVDNKGHTQKRSRREKKDKACHCD